MRSDTVHQMCPTSEKIEDFGGFSLSGKIVVVSGASSGIGAQAARAVSRAGAQVLVVARRQDRLEQLAGTLEGAHALAIDVSSPGAAELVSNEVTARFGRVDALINAAGVTNVAPAMREQADDLRRVLEVNVVGSFGLSQAMARLMREGGEGGSIVNVASVIASVSEPLIPQAAYAASKGAVVSMSREMAVQWARYGWVGWDVSRRSTGPSSSSPAVPAAT
jgi:NAD(P)-dependent dehydrogenase (short-subunit alcohol dehydrogenase family)